MPEDEWPRLSVPILSPRGDLVRAGSRSLRWFDYPSSQQFFPVEGITLDRARASVYALLAILGQDRDDPATVKDDVRREFDLYMSVGWDGEGTVLFTGYYAPVFTASRERTDRYRYPLYGPPPQLIRPETPGSKPQWRRDDGRMTSPPPRRELEGHPALRGHEIAWLEDPLDVYIIQVQGSARLEMTDGSTLEIGYAGDNGYDYVSLGREMVRDGRLDENHAGLPAIRDFFQDNPELLDEYVHRNPRFIFFQEYPRRHWPAGSLGFPVTAWRSVATDKSIFPRAMPVLADTTVPAPDGGTRGLRQVMFDQDTGSAIRAPGRADLFMGIGERAEAVAGRQQYEGRLYYFVLKPDRVDHWLERMEAEQPRAGLQ